MATGRTRVGSSPTETGIIRAMNNLARLTTVEPVSVDHVSKLPGAALSPGRIMYVGGTTKRLYMSDGTSWRQITVV